MFWHSIVQISIRDDARMCCIAEWIVNLVTPVQQDWRCMVICQGCSAHAMSTCVDHPSIAIAVLSSVKWTAQGCAFSMYLNPCNHQIAVRPLKQESFDNIQ